MHQADRPGFACAFNDVVLVLVQNVIRNRAGEHTIVPMRVKRAFVGARHDLEGSVLECDLVYKQQSCDEIVIGHGLKRKILVELHLGCSTRQL